ncbi:hypothetical protein TNCV_2960081, partial [Trichonephila clavipes]
MIAREFDIAHSVVSRQWKSFKTTGMSSRRHGEVVLEVRRLQKTDISFCQQKKQAHHSSAARVFNVSYGRRVLRDLNPIENVWDDALGRQVAGIRLILRTNKNTLIRALTEEWDKLPQQLLDNVVQ